jgi:acetyl-CoA acyltransferase
MERNPDVPKDRIDDVAIAATSQTGDQGLTLGRSAAILAGLPMTVPGFAIDRMCAGAMTSVTTMAGSIGFGMYDLAIAGGVEHMGRHPIGSNADPNPRFVAEKMVDPGALNMGVTAERLHDRFPQLTSRRRRQPMTPERSSLISSPSRSRLLRVPGGSRRRMRVAARRRRWKGSHR